MKIPNRILKYYKRLTSHSVMGMEYYIIIWPDGSGRVVASVQCPPPALISFSTIDELEKTLILNNAITDRKEQTNG